MHSFQDFSFHLAENTFRIFAFTLVASLTAVASWWQVAHSKAAFCAHFCVALDAKVLAITWNLMVSVYSGT